MIMFLTYNNSKKQQQDMGSTKYMCDSTCVWHMCITQSGVQQLRNKIMFYVLTSQRGFMCAMVTKYYQFSPSSKQNISNISVTILTSKRQWGVTSCSCCIHICPWNKQKQLSIWIIGWIHLKQTEIAIASVSGKIFFVFKPENYIKL